MVPNYAPSASSLCVVKALVYGTQKARIFDFARRGIAVTALGPFNPYFKSSVMAASKLENLRHFPMS